MEVCVKKESDYYVNKRVIYLLGVSGPGLEVTSEAELAVEDDAGVFIGTRRWRLIETKTKRGCGNREESERETPLLLLVRAL